MTESKHTTGPLKALRDDAGNLMIVDMASGDTIAHLTRHDPMFPMAPTDPEQLANALGMAAWKELLEACKAFLRRTDLATRWPCPNCGREDPKAKLRIIEIRMPGGTIETGCWLCNTDDVRELARAATAKATKGADPQ